MEMTGYMAKDASSPYDLNDHYYTINSGDTTEIVDGFLVHHYKETGRTRKHNLNSVVFIDYDWYES